MVNRSNFPIELVASGQRIQESQVDVDILVCYFKLGAASDSGQEETRSHDALLQGQGLNRVIPLLVSPVPRKEVVPDMLQLLIAQVLEYYLNGPAGYLGDIPVGNIDVQQPGAELNDCGHEAGGLVFGAGERVEQLPGDIVELLMLLAMGTQMGVAVISGLLKILVMHAQAVGLADQQGSN